MKKTAYGYSKEVNLDFITAVQNLTEAMKAEGFGVITSIDVKAKMKEKLDKDMDDYIILGACNPSYAYKTLQIEDEIGLLLPCNIIIYRKGGKTHVATIRPTQAMSIVNNEDLKQLAEEVEQKLTKAIDQV